MIQNMIVKYLPFIDVDDFLTANLDLGIMPQQANVLNVIFPSV